MTYCGEKAWQCKRNDGIKRKRKSGKYSDKYIHAKFKTHYLVIRQSNDLLRTRCCFKNFRKSEINVVHFLLLIQNIKHNVFKNLGKSLEKRIYVNFKYSNSTC